MNMERERMIDGTHKPNDEEIADFIGGQAGEAWLEISSSASTFTNRWTLPARITSLGLHITDSCTARCLHCAFNCNPEIEGCMELEKAKNYVSEAKAVGMEIVCITGGEPMLYPDLVKEIVSECTRLSVSNVWLFTNGFWANNSSEAFAIAENLRELGLTKVFLSVDAFHQGYVPIEFIKKAIRASLRADLDVSIDSRFIGQPDGKSRYDSTTRHLLERLGSLLSKIEIVKAQPLLVGRAAESLAQHIEKQPFTKILDMKCPGAWPGGTLKSPLGVDVDELGFVTICPGLSIGNTCAESLESMLRKYDYHNHTVVAALYDSGMRGLVDLTSHRGFVPEEAYVNGCHFCYEARKFLRTFLPDALCLASS